MKFLLLTHTHTIGSVGIKTVPMLYNISINKSMKHAEKKVNLDSKSVTHAPICGHILIRVVRYLE
jgi:hypothetical protein